jgi:hypothetical protein
MGRVEVEAERYLGLAEIDKVGVAATTFSVTVRDVLAA